MRDTRNDACATIFQVVMNGLLGNLLKRSYILGHPGPDLSGRQMIWLHRHLVQLTLQIVFFLAKHIYWSSLDRELSRSTTAASRRTSW